MEMQYCVLLDVFAMQTLVKLVIFSPQSLLVRTGNFLNTKNILDLLLYAYMYVL